MKHLIPATILAAAMPMAAFANGGAITLTYGQLDAGGGDDVDTYNLSGKYSYSFANGLQLNASLRTETVDGGGGSDFDLQTLNADLRYSFNGGFYAGAYVSQFSFDLLGDETVDGYGLLAGYDNGVFDVLGYAGVVEVDGATEDVTEIGLRGRYTGPNYDVFASYQNISDGSDDVNLAGVGGSYGFTPNWTAFGGYAALDSFFGPDGVDVIGLGVSYQTDGVGSTAISGVPVIFSFEVSQASANGTDLNGIKLGVTFPFGDYGSVIPDDSVAGIIANPGYNGFGNNFDLLY